MDGLTGATVRIAHAATVLAAILFCLLGGANAAAPEAKALKGIALVIGNSDYEHLSKLPNPANDARAIEELLDGLGFDTTVVADRNQRRLKRDLEAFVEDAEGADVAIVYYSGHGIEAAGENYLVPTDADVSALDSASESLVPIGPFLEQLKAGVPVTIVLLDACRNNPFPAGATLRTEPDAAPVAVATVGSGATRGAAPLAGVTSADETYGTVLGFAAEPGKVALDGPSGGNSPYAAALLRHLGALGGDEFGTVMRMVAEEVYLKTSGKQRPWVNENLRRLLYFGSVAHEPEGADGEILGERRQLLLTIAALPDIERRQIERLAASDAVPMDALYGMLRALGAETPKDPAELDRLLKGQTERLKTMLAERNALKSTDPEIARLSDIAVRALRDGALATAVKALDQAKARVETLAAGVDEAEAEVAARRREFGGVYARSGEAHFLAFDYAAAAKDFGDAYNQVVRSDDRLAWTYAYQRVEALERQGTLRGDNAALEAAVLVAREALGLTQKLQDKTAEARTQNALGNALFTLGDRESGPERLRQAAAAFRAALSTEAGGDKSLDANVRNNLANALTVLGTRAADTRPLLEAVDLYEIAIDQYEAEQDPVRWASAYTNFGKTLLELGKLQNSVDTLNMAGHAYEAALGITIREQAPYLWGGAWNNIGNVYQALGERMADPNVGAGRFLQALIAYRNALQELTRERYPVQWASTQLNLASSLRALSFSQSDPAVARDYLSQAIAAQDAALLEITRERAPSMWANVKRGLADTLVASAARAETPADRAKLFDAAARALNDALAVLAPGDAPRAWAETQAALAQNFVLRAQLDTDATLKRDGLGRAEQILRAALTGFAGGERKSERAALLHALGLTLIERAALDSGATFFEVAASAFREEEGLLSQDNEPARWAASQAGLGNALRGIGLARGDRALLEEARRRTLDARAAIQPFDTSYNGLLDQRLSEIEAGLAGLK